MTRRLWICAAIAGASLAVGAVPAGAAAPNGDPIVRFATSTGNIDVELLPQAAPNTVSNFLGYVNSGAYASTFFHRSDTGVGIIQGGSYQVQSGQRSTISTGAAIPLEYNLPNQRGTLAMARTSDPNSATSGWFFNVTDNTTELGQANGGGYAVFGKIISPGGMLVMDAIAHDQVVNDSTDGAQYGQLPVTGYTGGAVATSNLIMSPITVLPSESPTISVTFPAPNMVFTVGQQLGVPSYHCSEDANGTGIASCTAPALDVATPGLKQFTVTATDYAGDTTTQTVNYTVNAPPPAPKRVPVRAAALLGTDSVTKAGKVILALGCSTTTRCTGTVTVLWAAPHHRAGRVAFSRYAIGGYKAGAVPVRLSRAATRALDRSHKLVVSVRLAPKGGQAKTRRLTLRLPRH